MVRKIFVDSRFRDHGTPANFQFTLSSPVLHPKCRAYLDNIHIPNLFYTISEKSKYLYVFELWVNNPGTPQAVVAGQKRKIALEVGTYDIATLTAELLTKLNTGKSLPAGNDYVVTQSNLTGKITVSLTTAGNAPQAKIWPMEYLKANKAMWDDPLDLPTGPAVDDDCYLALGFTDSNIIEITSTAPYTAHAHVSILPLHTLYLTCAFGLGSNEDCIGARGGNILRSIPVNAGFGNMIHDQLQNPFDFISLEPGQLRSFSFALRDVFQREVPLHHGFSFSILLVEEE